MFSYEEIKKNYSKLMKEYSEYCQKVTARHINWNTFNGSTEDLDLLEQTHLFKLRNELCSLKQFLGISDEEQEIIAKQVGLVELKIGKQPEFVCDEYHDVGLS